MGVTTYSSAIFNFLPEWRCPSTQRAPPDRDAVYPGAAADFVVLPYIAIPQPQAWLRGLVDRQGGDERRRRHAGPVRPQLTELDAAERAELTALIGDRR